MKPLLNALAFAAIVIAAFVMDSNLPVQRLATNPTVARIAQTLRPEAPAVVAPELPIPPQIDQAKLDRALERMQVAQQRLERVDMERMEARMQAAQRAIVLSKCKVTKVEQ